MKRRFYFQQYEKLSSPDDLLRRLNSESQQPKFIDDIVKNADNNYKKKLINNYSQRRSQSLDPVRKIRMDAQKLQEEYYKFLTNTENVGQYKIINIEQQKIIPEQNNLCLAKVLSFKHQLMNPF